MASPLEIPKRRGFTSRSPAFSVDVVEDGLSSNAPHIYELQKHDCITSYFPPPIKQGLRKTAFLGLLAAIFAEIPVDSIWLSAN
jgi:hypothetical protein